MAQQQTALGANLHGTDEPVPEVTEADQWNPFCNTVICTGFAWARLSSYSKYLVVQMDFDIFTDACLKDFAFSFSFSLTGWPQGVG